MCSLFAHQPQRDYESQTRSLRISGHSTSIRLELSFWDTLEEIAAKEGLTLAKFLTTLHDEVLSHHGNVTNLASLLKHRGCQHRGPQLIRDPHVGRCPLLLRRSTQQVEPRSCHPMLFCRCQHFPAEHVPRQICGRGIAVPR